MTDGKARPSRPAIDDDTLVIVPARITAAHAQLDVSLVAATLAYAEAWTIVANGLGVEINPVDLVRGLIVDALGRTPWWDASRVALVEHAQYLIQARVRARVRAAAAPLATSGISGRRVVMSAAQLGAVDGLLASAHDYAIRLVAQRAVDGTLAAMATAITDALRLDLYRCARTPPGTAQP